MSSTLPFCVTSIPLSAPDANGLVKFSGIISGEDQDGTAAVLRDVTVTTEKDEGDHLICQGYVVEENEAMSEIAAKISDANTADKEILMAIHGNVVEPGEWIQGCIEAHKFLAESKYFLVPVIWPADSGGIVAVGDYTNNRKYAKAAGAAFKSVVNLSADIPLSVMAHSMGNFVFAKFFDEGTPELESGEKVKFNTYFCVAADVWEEIFNTRVIDGSMKIASGFTDQDVGLNVLNAVQKCVIVHAQDDRALRASASYHGNVIFKERRIGQFGMAGQGSRLCQRAQDIVTDVNFRGPNFETDTLLGHSYQFSEKICKDVYSQY